MPGTRRSLQITVTRGDLDALKRSDPLTSWKSIDEDDAAPMFANRADLDLVMRV